MKKIAGLLCATLIFMSSIVSAASVESGEPGSRIREMLAEWHKKDAEEKTGMRLSEKVGLVWQPRLEEGTDLSKTDRLPGMNVVSPCWFRVTDASGAVGAGELAPDKAYVKNAQKKGYKVWALVTNRFDAELTHALLADAAASKRAVGEIVKLAQEYNLDGINLDFENINEEDRDAFSAFAASLGSALHRAEKTYSVDVTFPGGSGNWSRCYDRAAIARVADYVIVMAYDEHARSSKVAGSVASLGWVEHGVKAMLAEVPAEKLVLGMPLYARIWEEEGGAVKDVKTLRMKEAETLLHAVGEKDVKKRWDAAAGQYYFEYKKGGRIFRVWQENARSLALKAALISRYNLAGGALWRRGFETSDVWPVIAAEIFNAQR